MESGDTVERTLEFESPRFLHALLGNDLRQLAHLEQTFGVVAVTRDAWLRLSGSGSDVERAVRVFDELEDVLRQGGEIGAREFRLAVDGVRGAVGCKVGELSRLRLVGSRGRRAVVPRTPAQLDYARAISSHDVVFGLGPAGTGKTYLAMAVALDMLKRREVLRVVLTRPAVEAGEALGFLPGDLREKVAPYLRPLYDAIQEMLDPEEARRYFEDGVIEVAPLAFMRGRTLSSSFLILDEAQNTTREQMFMALTRLGEGSRMVVTGDGSQVDLRAGVRSGLVEAENALADVEGVAFCRFGDQDIIRHPVVGRIVTAYGRYRS